MNQPTNNETDPTQQPEPDDEGFAVGDSELGVDALGPDTDEQESVQ